MKMIPILFCLGLFTSPLFAKEKGHQEDKEVSSTREKARDMFRAPSSEDEGKIKDKFQPIDHKIKTSDEEKKP